MDGLNERLSSVDFGFGQRMAHPIRGVGLFPRNRWASSVGMGGPLRLEWVGLFRRNRWASWVGIRIQMGVVADPWFDWGDRWQEGEPTSRFPTPYPLDLGGLVRKKTQKAQEFIEGLHGFVTGHPQFRKKTAGKTESQIKTQIRPIIIRYLEEYFEEEGYSDAVGKANKSFCWEGQEGPYGRGRETTFGTRNYPDFIITDPYLVAIEYKQSPNGSVVKHGIGQSIMHTLSDEFDFVYYLFHDESNDKRIEKLNKNEREAFIIQTMWQDFNVFIRFV